MLRGGGGEGGKCKAAFVVVKETHLFGQILYIPPEINKKTISLSNSCPCPIDKIQGQPFFCYNLLSFLEFIICNYKIAEIFQILVHGFIIPRPYVI